MMLSAQALNERKEFGSDGAEVTRIAQKCREIQMNEFKDIWSNECPASDIYQLIMTGNVDSFC